MPIARHACAWLGGLALGLTACFSPTYPTGLDCSPSGACPPDQTCDRAVNKCVADGTDLRPPAPVISDVDGAVRWEVSPRAASYAVMRVTTPGGAPMQVATTTAGAFVDTDVDDGDTFAYTVIARNAAGESSPSNQLMITHERRLCVTSADRVATFPTGQDGDGGPVHVIRGAGSMLTAPYGIFADLVNDEIVVTNHQPDFVAVFPRAANGDVAPLRIIAGAATGLSTVYGVVVDPLHDEILVANNAANTITVYPRNASGNVAPVRTLGGPSTTLSAPYAIALDPVRDEIYVTNFQSQTYLVFPRDAAGDVAPRRSVSTGTPTSIAYDTEAEEVFVVAYTQNVFVFARDADGAAAAPLRSINVAAYAVNVDPRHDELYVSRSGGISIYSRDTVNLDPPRRSIEGGMTGFGNPWYTSVCH